MAYSNRRWAAAPAVIAVVLGMALAVQMKTQEKVEQAVQETRVTEASVDQLVSVMRELERLEAERDRLREVVSRNALLREIEEHMAASGLEAVVGDGVTVLLADPGTNDELEYPLTTRKVSVEDVLLVLNELRAGGAEAIAINGIRVTARTRITRQGGSSGPLAVDGEVLMGPVLIQALGDPQTLSSSLNLRGGVVTTLAPWIQIGVRESADLVIPAVKQVPDYNYARPSR